MRRAPRRRSPRSPWRPPCAGRLGARPSSPIRRQGRSLQVRLSGSWTYRISGRDWRRGDRRAGRPVMMLWAPELAVVPVTIHLPLAEAPRALSTDLIVETGRITARDLPKVRHRHGRGLRLRHSIRTPAKTARWGPRTSPSSSPASGYGSKASASRRAARFPADTMFHPGARADLRCRFVHVSRSGADPDQDACLRPRRQCHLGVAVRAHLARSWHRLRYRRYRHRRPFEPHRGFASGREAGSARGLRPPHDGGSTICHPCAM